MKDSIGNLSSTMFILRPLALTIPAVTVDERENGFPTATTHSPTARFLELPKVIAGRFVSLIFRTAKSVEGSVPINSASYDFLLYNTWIFSAASTTWLLVTIKPSAEKITPDPE